MQAHGRKYRKDENVTGGSSESDPDQTFGVSSPGWRNGLSWQPSLLDCTTQANHEYCLLRHRRLRLCCSELGLLEDSSSRHSRTKLLEDNVADQLKGSRSMQTVFPCLHFAFRVLRMPLNSRVFRDRTVALLTHVTPPLGPTPTCRHVR
jgi:hypothetical protein